MKKMLVLTLALSVFAVGSVLANDANNSEARGPKRVNVNLVLPAPPPAPHGCCDHHKPMPPKHGAKIPCNCKKSDVHHPGARPEHRPAAPGVRPNKRPTPPPAGAPRPAERGNNNGPRGENRR